MPPLLLLGGGEVQTLLNFLNQPSPHRPPSPIGEGGPPDGGPAEGAAAYETQLSAVRDRSPRLEIRFPTGAMKDAVCTTLSFAPLYHS